MNISKSKETIYITNINIENEGNYLQSNGSGYNERTAFYERFQKENIDFIKTLLRLKSNKSNNYIDTDTYYYANSNIKTYNPTEEIKDGLNKILLLHQYPKPYQPQISSSSKSKRNKSRSLIKNNHITTIYPIERQKCFFSPFIKQQIQTPTNKNQQTVISYTSSNHKTSIIPKYTRDIQRTNSTNVINQPSMSTSTSTNKNKNNRSSSMHNNQKRMSINNTTPTRMNSCMTSHKKAQRERVLYDIKKSDCNIISIVLNKKKQLNNVKNRYSNSSKPKSIPKSVIIEKQKPNIPIAEIDLYSENKHEPKKLFQKENGDDIKRIPNNNKLIPQQKFVNNMKKNNRSFYDIKTKKQSLSFIEKVPFSPQSTDNINHFETNTNKPPTYKFEMQKKERIDKNV